MLVVTRPWRSLLLEYFLLRVYMPLGDSSIFRSNHGVVFIVTWAWCNHSFKLLVLRRNPPESSFPVFGGQNRVVLVVARSWSYYLVE